MTVFYIVVFLIPMLSFSQYEPMVLWEISIPSIHLKEIINNFEYSEDTKDYLKTAYGFSCFFLYIFQFIIIFRNPKKENESEKVNEEYNHK